MSTTNTYSAGDRKRCERFISMYGDGFTYLEKVDEETGDWFKMSN